jgi:hypothetical protein
MILSNPDEMLTPEDQQEIDVELRRCRIFALITVGCLVAFMTIVLWLKRAETPGLLPGTVAALPLGQGAVFLAISLFMRSRARVKARARAAVLKSPNSDAAAESASNRPTSAQSLAAGPLLGVFHGALVFRIVAVEAVGFAAAISYLLSPSFLGLLLVGLSVLHHIWSIPSRSRLTSWLLDQRRLISQNP